MGTVYGRKALKGEGGQRRFNGEDLQQIAFPLGGLGAGCLHLGGAGNFQDFCLFNAPAFGHSPMTFAAVHCQTKGRKTSVMRVLEGPVQNPHIYNQGRFGGGRLASGHEGLPHMQGAEFRGEFPFDTVRLQDRELPLQVRLEAFSPFVPGDELNSGLPAAFVCYHLRNRLERSLQVQFSFNVQYPGLDEDLQGYAVEHIRRGPTQGLYFDSDRAAEARGKTTIAVVSPRAGQNSNCAWFRGGWFDALSILTGQLLEGKLKSAPRSRPVEGRGGSRLGATLFWDLELKPGEQVEIPLIYCWHAPGSELRHGQVEEDGCCEVDDRAAAYRPWYSTRFEDAWKVAEYAVENHQSLKDRTRRFHRALFSSTLPAYVLDAVSANLAILKSPTVLRQEDGMLWCWEGSSYDSGCCAGSCTHVWNYAQALPYLFPSLERTLRDQELMWSMDRRGHVIFRTALPTGPVEHVRHAAADGQLGGIVKLFREWQIGGDHTWLEARYPLARRSLEYCIRTWDPHGQGALVEPHHNTYDIEFWGADIMCTSFYLGALQAMAAMALHLGREEDARRYSVLAEKGKAYCDQNLWNGEFYVQKVQLKGLRASRRLNKWVGDYSEEALELLRREGPKYQYGPGCIADGVMGQWYTSMLGLKQPLNRSRVKRHLAAIFKYNFRNSLRGHANPQRPGYALNDEPGLLLCSWPRDGKPSLPFVYSDEVWTGIEYQVASHMVYEGLVDEGLTLVNAVRQRYDGRVRNPWNEYECGNYYARALASYGVLLALTGFRYSAPARRLDLGPRLGPRKGCFFFAVDSGWGRIHYRKTGGGVQVRIQVEEGLLEVGEVRFGRDLPGKMLRQKLPEVEVARPGKDLVLDIS